MKRFKSILTLVLMVSVSLLMAQNKSANVAPKKLDAFEVNKISLSNDKQISFTSYKNEVAPLLNKIAQNNNERAITMSKMGHSVNIFFSTIRTADLFECQSRSKHYYFYL